MAEVDPILYQFGMAILAGAFAAGGAWFAVRTDMKYLRRDVDENRNEIKAVEARRSEDVRLIHGRIDRVNERVTACSGGHE